MRLTLVIQPAFDDLNTIQVGPIRIPQGPNHKGWRFAAGGLSQVATHGHTAPVALDDEIGTVYFLSLEIPAGKQAHPDAGPGGGVDFLAFHGTKDFTARVLTGPYGSETGGTFL